MTHPAIDVLDLNRDFGRGSSAHVALRDVTFQVSQGETVGLLGPNGAGKTTITKIVSTLLAPSSGRVSVCGLDVTKNQAEVRRLSSVVLGGDRGLYPRLTGRQNLRFFGAIDGISAPALRNGVGEMLERVGLGGAADRRVETYSKGMRQRLHIAIGMLKHPRVLLLDEPTVGLDPTEAQRLREELRQLKADGVAILLTSHQLLDIEALADRVVLLDSGSVSADLTLREFAALAEYEAVVEVSTDPPDDLTSRVEGTSFQADPLDGTRATATVRTWNTESFERMWRALVRIAPSRVHVRSATLNDAFRAVDQAERRS